ncbi:ribonuclease T2-like [Cadophora gregata]|uniref:ribonuclease T2-like n=1 Tax=Cadophora gregata TaxID=51156 RepID=UPI0026DB20BA|nr:ribonuclease T2-like [Cadophora gregata]KAK0121757.1 ribonuclease T2-like [Cadophora gregata]
MTSLQTLTQYAANVLNLAQLPLLSNAPSFPTSQSPFAFSAVPNAQSTFDHTCPIDSPVSCHNSTSFPDSCCFIYPGGQLLQTQFWDTTPSVGPKDSWTLHGLWPDLCDGSYPTFCKAAPMYHNITAILASANAPLEPPNPFPSSSSSSTSSSITTTTTSTLLDYMQTYWLPNRGSADSFWEHEWNKHGTCINTLSPSCYTSPSSSSSSEFTSESYKSGDEVVDFFTRAVSLFRSLDTYSALASAGIVPSARTTYRREQIEVALKKVTGADVLIRCRGNRLNEVWYSFNVKGSLQEGKFVPSEPVGKVGRGGCPPGGVRYLPKH